MQQHCPTASICATTHHTLAVHVTFRFHKPHQEILEFEAPKVAIALEKTSKKLRKSLHGAQTRIEERVVASKHTVAAVTSHESEIDSMVGGDDGRDFKFLEENQTLRSAAQAEKGAAAMELVDLPPCEEGNVYFTLANGMHMQVPRDERNKRLAELETSGEPRVGQLDDPASRPVHHASLPFGVAIVVGVGAVVMIASGLRQLTVARTIEWLGGTVLALLLSWLVLDPLKIVLLTPLTTWALKRKLRQMQRGSKPKLSLADALLSTAAALQGTGETERLKRCIQKVVLANRAAEELQREGVLRATREEKERIAAEAERRLAAAITSALSDVEGNTDHITTLKQALHAKQVQKKQALLQANAELDSEISDMLASRVEDWEEDWQHRESEVTPAQLYHRAMIEYESEVNELDEKAKDSKHRLEQALGARAAMRQQQKQERDLAEQKKQMEARLQRAQECMQRHQAKVRRAAHNVLARHRTHAGLCSNLAPLLQVMQLLTTCLLRTSLFYTHDDNIVTVRQVNAIVALGNLDDVDVTMEYDIQVEQGEEEMESELLGATLAQEHPGVVAQTSWETQRKEQPLSVRQRIATMLRVVTRQTTAVKQFTSAIEPEPEPEPEALEPEDAATIALRERLIKLRPVALHKRCVAEGVDADRLEEAMSMEDMKAALIELLVQASIGSDHDVRGATTA